MQVLIISTNRNIHPAPVIPYGACIVAEAAAREGHLVSFLDLMFQPDHILPSRPGSAAVPLT